MACIIFLSDSDILSHRLGLNLGICELVRGRRVKTLSIFVICFFFLAVPGLSSEKAMAPHSSTLAWKIPWMEEPGRLQSMGSLRVGHS